MIEFNWDEEPRVSRVASQALHNTVTTDLLPINLSLNVWRRPRTRSIPTLVPMLRLNRGKIKQVERNSKKMLATVPEVYLKSEWEKSACTLQTAADMLSGPPTSISLPSRLSSSCVYSSSG